MNLLFRGNVSRPTNAAAITASAVGPIMTEITFALPATLLRQRPFLGAGAGERANPRFVGGEFMGGS